MTALADLAPEQVPAEVGDDLFERVADEALSAVPV
jgi:hypothetical protein